MKRTLGGGRLGSENVMPKVYLDTPGRSNVNISRMNRFGATPGVLYPAFVEEMTAGDFIHGHSNSLIKTIPTEGPLFGSYKSQLDFFFVPLRLYVKELHNNMLNFEPNNVHWPQIKMVLPTEYAPITIGQRYALEYINYRILASEEFKKYDANGDGYVEIDPRINIVKGTTLQIIYVDEVIPNPLPDDWDIQIDIVGSGKGWTSLRSYVAATWSRTSARTLTINVTKLNGPIPTVSGIRGGMSNAEPGTEPEVEGLDLLRHQVAPSALMHFLGYSGAGHSYPTVRSTITDTRNAIGVLGYYDIFKNYYANTQEKQAYVCQYDLGSGENQRTVLKPFDLENIDNVRMDYLSRLSPQNTPIDKTWMAPYNYAAQPMFKMSGLVVKTHMADRFNAFLNNDTVNSIINRTMVAVENGAFSIDALRLANKVNEMLQKTLVSGGTWTDWLQVQYGDAVRMQCEIPVWIGSTSGEVTFEDVTSTAETEGSPLGTLAGKGHGRWNEEKIKFNIDEPGIVMGIFSLTPRVDYSMGNRDYLRRKTLGDSHIPALDAIGFQDLLTDTMAAFDNQFDEDGNIQYRAIYKQPAWTEYMTATNESHGALAAGGVYSWMALNRIYHTDNEGEVSASTNSLGDGTSYIDPRIYNQVFADTDLTAENFWVQLQFTMHVKRPISKKVMPSL